MGSLTGEKLRKQNSLCVCEEKRAESRPVWLEPRVFSCTFPSEVRVNRSDSFQWLSLSLASEGCGGPRAFSEDAAAVQ